LFVFLKKTMFYSKKKNNIKSFGFFIGRGLMRRFMVRTWSKIRIFWNKAAPNKVQKVLILLFFSSFLII
jgi:hypothetical protein